MNSNGTKNLLISAYVTLFKGNKYENISMGSNQYFNGSTFLYARGSLHKLYNVLAADFQDESYINIGAFNVEHLNETLLKIKGECSAYPLKGPLNVTFANANKLTE